VVFVVAYVEMFAVFCQHGNAPIFIATQAGFVRATGWFDFKLRV
jgi:hypothetical protein